MLRSWNRTIAPSSSRGGRLSQRMMPFVHREQPLSDEQAEGIRCGLPKYGFEGMQFSSGAECKRNEATASDCARHPQAK